MVWATTSYHSESRRRCLSRRWCLQDPNRSGTGCRTHLFIDGVHGGDVCVEDEGALREAVLFDVAAGHRTGLAEFRTEMSPMFLTVDVAPDAEVGAAISQTCEALTAALSDAELDASLAVRVVVVHEGGPRYRVVWSDLIVDTARALELREGVDERVGNEMITLTSPAALLGVEPVPMVGSSPDVRVVAGGEEGELGSVRIDAQPPVTLKTPPRVWYRLCLSLPMNIDKLLNQVESDLLKTLLDDLGARAARRMRRVKNGALPGAGRCYSDGDRFMVGFRPAATPDAVLMEGMPSLGDDATIVAGVWVHDSRRNRTRAAVLYGRTLNGSVLHSALHGPWQHAAGTGPAAAPWSLEAVDAFLGVLAIEHPPPQRFSWTTDVWARPHLAPVIDTLIKDCPALEGFVHWRDLNRFSRLTQRVLEGPIGARVDEAGIKHHVKQYRLKGAK